MVPGALGGLAVGAGHWHGGAVGCALVLDVQVGEAGARGRVLAGRENVLLNAITV